jgi:ATP-dependent DNA ligase
VSSEAGSRFDQNVTGFRAEEEFGFNATPYVATGKFVKISACSPHRSGRACTPPVLTHGPAPRRYHPGVLPAVVPQLVANDGVRALRQAIADPERFACEPKVDGVRGLVVYHPDRVMEMRNRRGEKRDWLRGDEFEAGLRRLADRLPNLWEGTVLDGELTAGRFEGTMSALLGSKRFRPSLRFVVFDVPVLLGADLRSLPWHARRERLELLARGFDVPLELSPLVDPSVSLVGQMTDGRLEGIVLKDRTSTYRDGTRVGWSKVKDRSWYEREAWRFDRH